MQVGLWLKTLPLLNALIHRPQGLSIDDSLVVDKKSLVTFISSTWCLGYNVCQTQVLAFQVEMKDFLFDHGPYGDHGPVLGLLTYITI